MRDAVYAEERRLCAEVIDKTGLFASWTWERNANAGPYCSLDICLGNASTVDGLILILGDELTDVTRQEYEVARGRHIPRFVLIDQRKAQNEAAEAFIQTVRAEPGVTKSFENLVELETYVLEAIREMNSRNWRSHAHAVWERRHGAAA
jgi:hypothetical protein